MLFVTELYLLHSEALDLLLRYSTFYNVQIACATLVKFALQYHIMCFAGELYMMYSEARYLALY